MGISQPSLLHTRRSFYNNSSAAPRLTWGRHLSPATWQSANQLSPPRHSHKTSDHQFSGILIVGIKKREEFPPPGFSLSNSAKTRQQAHRPFLLTDHILVVCIGSHSDCGVTHQLWNSCQIRSICKHSGRIQMPQVIHSGRDGDACTLNSGLMDGFRLNFHSTKNAAPCAFGPASSLPPNQTVSVKQISQSSGLNFFAT